MIFKLPCTITISLDDSELRLLDLSPNVGPPSARGAHLAGVNAARAAEHRAAIERVKPQLLELLDGNPQHTVPILEQRGKYSRNAVYTALKELRLSGAVVIDGSGRCALAPKGAPNANQ